MAPSGTIAGLGLQHEDSYCFEEMGGETVMRGIARVVGIGLAVLAVAAGVSAQSPPSTKLLIGTWKFSPQKSKMVNGPAPREVTRTYEDRGNGTYSYTQVGISADGVRTESRYVAREDGTENELFRIGADNAPVSAGTISFSRIDANSTWQTQTGPGFTVTAMRTISADGRTMTLSVGQPISGNNTRSGADPAPDIMVFEKQ